jgi:hypothetical protein
MAKTEKKEIAGNLFSSAAVKPTLAPKKKKGEKEEVFIGDELDFYAAIDITTKTLGSIKDMYKEAIETKTTNHFINETIATGNRPENFKGLGNLSEASCELRKRSSASPLSSTELEVLKQYNISTQTEIIQIASGETFSFSDEVMELIEGNPKLAIQISNALSAIPGLKGSQILTREEPKEEVSIQIVCDQSFSDAAKIKDPETLKQLYDIIGTKAIGKPKMATDNFSDVLDLLKKAGIKMFDDKKKSK